MKLSLILALPWLAVAQYRYGSRGDGPVERDCVCPGFNPPSCPTGSLCECQNQAKITCWAQWGGNCQVGIKVCPVSPGGSFGASPGFSSEYPPCGQLLPACATGKVCRKLDNFCDDSNRGATCIGLCIPVAKLPAQTPKASTPKASPGTPSKESPGKGAYGAPAPNVPAIAPASPSLAQPAASDLPAWPAKGPKGKPKAHPSKGGSPKQPYVPFNITQIGTPLPPKSVVRRSLRQ